MARNSPHHLRPDAVITQGPAAAQKVGDLLAALENVAYATTLGGATPERGRVICPFLALPRAHRLQFCLALVASKNAIKSANTPGEPVRLGNHAGKPTRYCCV